MKPKIESDVLLSVVTDVSGRWTDENLLVHKIEILGGKKGKFSNFHLKYAVLNFS